MVLVIPAVVLLTTFLDLFNRSRAVRRAFSSGSPWGDETQREERKRGEERRGKERRGEERREGRGKQRVGGRQGERQRGAEERRGPRLCLRELCGSSSGDFGSSLGKLGVFWEQLESPWVANFQGIAQKTARKQQENPKNIKTQIEKSKNATDHHGWACNGDFGQLCGTC